jgi:tRNA A-37 threonylcarbamoyl transferase component Bud32
MEPTVGRAFGPYQVTGPIGAGGMASVYRAYQPGMDRYVAIKVLPPAYALDSRFVERFRREARTIARLEHAHIVPVYDFGEADGSLYLVMRLFESGTLYDRMKQGPLSPAEIARIFNQIGDALDYAHSQGVIHRDLKPTNVLLDRRGDCYLSDFGIAKLLEGTAFTTSGSVLGTPQYASPEQVFGQPVDHRTDLYALGVMLYEMVTGKLPFEADTPMGLVMKHAQETPAPPRTHNPSISPELEAVILKALAKNPDDRYQTGEQLAQAIARASGGQPGAPTAFAPRRQPPAEPAGASLPPTAIQAEPVTASVASGPVTSAPLPARAARSRNPGMFALAGGLAACVLLALVAAGVGLAARQPITAFLAGLAPAPTEAPEPTEALLATEAPEPTEAPEEPTAPPEEPAELPVGEDLEEGFDDDSLGWYMAYDSGSSDVYVDTGSTELVVSASEYAMVIAAADGMGEYSDAVIDAETHVDSGVDYKYGLACRAQPDTNSGYVVLLRYANLVRISRWDEGTESLYDEIETDLFNFDEENSVHMQLSCRGSTITVSVNGSEVYSFEDDTYPAGYIAVFVENLSAEAPAVIHLDSLTVTVP